MLGELFANAESNLLRRSGASPIHALRSSEVIVCQTSFDVCEVEQGKLTVEIDEVCDEVGVKGGVTVVGFATAVLAGGSGLVGR